MIEGPVTAKILGIVAGTFLALVFIPPRTVTGFVRRCFSAFVFGWLFGHVVLEHLSWAPTDENMAAAWAIASFASWWTMGVAKKVVEKVASNYDG